MKAKCLNTDTIHNIVSIDFDANLVILASKEYGRTKTTLNKVKFILDKNESLIDKKIVVPKNFWMIPFVGLFMCVYKIFSEENVVIDFGEGSPDIVRKILIIFGPILIVSLSLLLYINF